MNGKEATLGRFKSFLPYFEVVIKDPKKLVYKICKDFGYENIDVEARRRDYKISYSLSIATDEDDWEAENL